MHLGSIRIRNSTKSQLVAPTAILGHIHEVGLKGLHLHEEGPASGSVPVQLPQAVQLRIARELPGHCPLKCSAPHALIVQLPHHPVPHQAVQLRVAVELPGHRPEEAVAVGGHGIQSQAVVAHASAESRLCGRDEVLPNRRAADAAKRRRRRQQRGSRRSVVEVHSDVQQRGHSQRTGEQLRLLPRLYRRKLPPSLCVLRPAVHRQKIPSGQVPR
mmetsp:Transcript_48790/g.123752  ORF Transcript_48790/g.123752 Transcript_48790/m.123752 type:complete len:215 (-) Transcript_48790:511-1155(-)